MKREIIRQTILWWWVVLLMSGCAPDSTLTITCRDFGGYRYASNVANYLSKIVTTAGDLHVYGYASGVKGAVVKVCDEHTRFTDGRSFHRHKVWIDGVGYGLAR